MAWSTCPLCGGPKSNCVKLKVESGMIKWQCLSCGATFWLRE